MNIQSSLSDLSSDVTDISNIGILKENSIFRTLQKGTVNQTAGDTVGLQPTNTKTVAFHIPLTTLANLDKCSFENNLNISAVSNSRITDKEIILNNNEILAKVTFYASDFGGWGSVKIEGSWMIKELF